MLACIAFRKRSHSEISTHKRAAGQTTCTRTGDLPHALDSRARPVREGHKPNCGHERTGEVGLCRSTSEPGEQRRPTFCGGRGGEGHRLRRTLFNHTCVRHTAGKACPGDCTVCSEQQKKGSRNGSPPCSTT